MRTRHQSTVARTSPANGHRDARIGVETVKLRGHVELHQIPLAQAAGAGDAMSGLVVDADAGHPGKAVVELRSRPRTSPPEDGPSDRIKLARPHARPDRTPHHPQRLGHYAPSRPQRRKLLDGLDRHESSVREARTRCLIAPVEDPRILLRDPSARRRLLKSPSPDGFARLSFRNELGSVDVATVECRVHEEAGPSPRFVADLMFARSRYRKGPLSPLIGGHPPLFL